MKKTHIILLLLAVLLCSSCYTSWRGFTNEQLLSVHKGATLEEVKTAFGEPYYRSFDDKGETWEFRKLGAAGWSVALVRIVDGRITEMQTYLEQNCQKETTKSSTMTTIVTADGKHVHGAIIQ